MAASNWDSIGSGNGWVPDGTKPLPEPQLIYHHWGPVTFIAGQFHKRYHSHQSLGKNSLKIIYSQFHSNLPGVNELTHCGLGMPYDDQDLGWYWLRQWLGAWQYQAITWTNVDQSGSDWWCQHWYNLCPVPIFYGNIKLFPVQYLPLQYGQRDLSSSPTPS